MPRQAYRELCDATLFTAYLTEATVTGSTGGSLATPYRSGLGAQTIPSGTILDIRSIICCVVLVWLGCREIGDP